MQTRSPLEDFLWAEGRLDARRQKALDQLRWGTARHLPPSDVIRVDLADFGLIMGPVFEPARQRRIVLPKLFEGALVSKAAPDPSIALFDADGHKVGDFPLTGDVGLCLTETGAFRYDAGFQAAARWPQTCLAAGDDLAPVGSTLGPVDVQLNATTETALVTHRVAGTVFYVDLLSGTLINKLRLRTSGDPSPMPIAWAGNQIYVALQADGPLWAYDLLDGRSLGPVEGPGWVTNVVITPDGRALLVLAAAPKFAVYRIDLKTMAVTHTMPLPGEPFSRSGTAGDLMTISPDGSRLLVMSSFSEPDPDTPIVHVLNLKTGRMIRRVRFRAARKPTGLAFAVENPYFVEPRPLEESLVEQRVVTWEDLIQIREILDLAGPPPEPGDHLPAPPSVEMLAAGGNWRRAVAKPAHPLTLPPEIDPLIAHFLGKLFLEQTGLELGADSDRLDERLLLAAAEARHQLGSATAAPVSVPNLLQGKGLSTVISRDQVAEWRQVLAQIEVSLIETATETGLVAPGKPTQCPSCDTRLRGRTTCPTCGLLVTPTHPLPAVAPKWLRQRLTQATIDPCLFLPVGHLLLTDPVRQRVIEVDNDGAVIWQMQVDRTDPILSRLLLWPIDALRLANDNTLVLDRMGRHLHEVSPDGRPYWEWPSSAGVLVEPVRVARNEWGETHVVDRLAHRIRRVDATGQPMRGYGSGVAGIAANEVFMPTDIHVLLNGHMLITDCGNHRVIEVVDGEVIWQFGNRFMVSQGGDGDGLKSLHTPRRALRLPRHRTAILDSGNHRVLIVDREGQVDWSFDTMALPNELAMECPLGLQRVGDDHLAVWDNRTVVQIDRDGNIVWAALLGSLIPNPRLLKSAPEAMGDGTVARRLWHVRQMRADDPERRAISDAIVERISVIQPIKSAWFNDQREKVIRLLRELSLKRLAILSKSKPWQIDLVSLKERTARVRTTLIALAKARLGAAFAGVAEVTETSEAPAPRSHASPPPARTEEPVPTVAEVEPLSLERPPFIAVVVQRTRHRVLLVDRQQEILWTWGHDELNMPQSASLLANGHVLVADSGHHRIIEVDPTTNEIVWETAAEMGLNFPRGAQRLPNGHTLIADSGNHRLLELNEDKQVSWRWSGRDLVMPTTCQRLPDGGTLLADWGLHVVFEIGPNGDIVWTYGRARRWGSEAGQLHHPEAAVRLDNGHTLIVDGRNQRAIEVTPNGEIAWSGAGLAGPIHARRMADGATLIAYSGGHFLVEVGSAGEVLWRASLGQDA